MRSQTVRHPFVAVLLRSIAAVFDRQHERLQTLAGQGAPWDVHPGTVNYFGMPDSRRHNRGGTAAAQRAACKRRNVIRNRRAHRG